MNKTLLKSIALVLALVLSLGMLSGCSKQEEADVDAFVDAAVQAALADAKVPFTVTIDADGKQVTFEDAEGSSLQQLLDQGKITLNKGDLLSLDPGQSIGSTMTVRVLRACNISITVVAENPAKDVTYHTVLIGGTVADAIEAVGLKLAKNQIVNYKLEDVLVDNMAIIISTKVEEEKATETAPTEPETTEDTASEEEWSEDDWSDDDWSDDDWSDDGWYEEDWSGDDWSEPETTPPATEPPVTEPPATEPPATDPPVTAPYVVSEEVYLDCDGSGHGVKVITYSDGTQEEVYF